MGITTARSKARRGWTLLLVPALLLGGACKRERAEEPAQEVARTLITYEIQVTNPMPHAMKVYAEYGAGEQELGVVEPNGTRTFTFTSEPITAATLKARAEDGSHEATGEASFAERNSVTWTIQ
jgi:P pilus assembly chaperone PapD